MNTYKKLVGKELLLKIKSFGKLDNNNINRAIFLCGYYRKNNANEIILDPAEFAKAYKNAKSKKKNNLDTNVYFSDYIYNNLEYTS